MISFTARDHRVKHGDDQWDHRRLDRRTPEACRGEIHLLRKPGRPTRLHCRKACFVGCG